MGQNTGDYAIIKNPELKDAIMLAGWVDDASDIGRYTLDYILRETGCEFCAEILPDAFFPMAGVSVVDNVAQFPECKFYVSSHHNLLVFRGNIPRMDWYRFLQAMMDVAKIYSVKKIYTVGAMVSVAAHTMPRVLVAIANTAEVKSELEPYNVMTDSDFETPAGQKPTLSSYLAWIARQKNITAVNLWVPVPFYLVQAEDPRACKRLIYFFNDKYKLGVDFSRLDAKIASQNKKMVELFQKSPVIESYVRRLETGEGLDAEQSEQLVNEVLEHLKKDG